MPKVNLVVDPEYGYLRLDPLPTQEELDEYYRNEFYASSVDRFNESAIETRIAEDEYEFFNAQYTEIAEICDSFIGPLAGRSLLDIGCGYGDVLAFFQNRGMTVFGVEPSPVAAKHGRERGLNILCGNIEQCDFVSTDKYSVITMMNAMEHLRRPATVLNKLRETMMENSVLVIDVPNEFNWLQTTADNEYGLDQWWLAPPLHINYFTLDSISRLLRSCGYAVLDSVASFPMEMFLLMGNNYVNDSEEGKRCHQRRVAFERVLRLHGQKERLLELYRMFAALGIGRQITVYASLEISQSFPGYITQKDD